ncbi:hypothetical protein GZH47_32970 (plasmid) [Paenibacillus rhizovicinus]|uniref:Uncharacterized protein n=1 Tax=Paenibacillus rhizovicinus TaxID=2704463 RepID=A0A6C0PAZ4_9BACL|nr:hypothetical protein [Paenibacillus rhizovicinus]QHW35707.1 hypothetical protein GZH47_32970 [Paenibacillus rhizovicinus]
MELVNEYCCVHQSFMLHDIEIRVGDYVGFTYTAPTMSYEISGNVHGFDISAGLMFMIIDDKYAMYGRSAKKHAVYGYPLDQVKDLYFPAGDVD